MTEIESKGIEMPQQELMLNTVTYQKGSVVSRVLIKEGNGSVTAFAFTAGEEISAHSTPFSALLYIIEGKAEVFIGDVKYVLQTGETINLPKNITHAINAITDLKMFLVMVR
jgi:quercetin dioxygenase-like cupin family protein